MNPQRRNQKPRRRQPPHGERAKALELRDSLAEPALAWMEYLRQEPWDRFPTSKTLDLARKMQLGAGDVPLYASGMAYAEAALFSSETEYLTNLDKARKLTMRAFKLADNPAQKLYYASRTYCMPLYAMPNIEPKMNEDELETMLDGVNGKLDELLEIIRDAQLQGGQDSDLAGVLRGATVELSVLRSLQRPDLVRSEFVALPAFPWEERSLRKHDLFVTRNTGQRSTYVMPIAENRNYDIGVACLKDPSQVIPIQVKASESHGLYHESINIVTAPKLAAVICAELELPYRPFNILMNRCSQEEREKRYKVIGDYLIDEILKIS